MAVGSEQTLLDQVIAERWSSFRERAEQAGGLPMARKLGYRAATPPAMTRIHSLSTALLLLLTAACAADPAMSEDTESGNLADACEHPADDPGLDVEDLEAGQAAIQAIWTDPSGAKTVWRQVSSTARIWHGDGNGDLTRYGLWLPLLHPEDMGQLYMTAVFEGPVDGITEPGSYMRVSSNWDIAFLEQGGSNAEVPGSIEITEVEGELASGTVSASSGPIEIIDYVRQGPSGDVVCVQAIAFRELLLEPPD